MSLHKKLIRLAYEHPELREDILPLLEKDTRVAALSKTAGALRIYEYIGEDGVVFWSFTRLSHMEMRRLYLTEPRGNHYRTHIGDIHRLAHVDEDELPGTGHRPRYGDTNHSKGDDRE